MWSRESDDSFTMRYTLIKVTQLTIFQRNGHTIQIGVVPYCLKIAPDEQQIDGVAIALFELGYTIVSSIQGSMAAALYCNLVFVNPSGYVICMHYGQWNLHPVY